MFSTSLCGAHGFRPQHTATWQAAGLSLLARASEYQLYLSREFRLDKEVSSLHGSGLGEMRFSWPNSRGGDRTTNATLVYMVSTIKRNQ